MSKLEELIQKLDKRALRQDATVDITDLYDLIRAIQADYGAFSQQSNTSEEKE